MYKKPFLKAGIEGTGWQEYKGEHLPETEPVKNLIEKTGMFRYPGGWYKAYYKGDMNTTDQWIIVTKNGRYYKVGAQYMVWQPNGCSSARWTVNSMKQALVAIFKDKTIPFDPDYQN